jgi:DNA primase
MDIIDKYIKRFSPPHPEDIVIRNWLYPKGLTEKDIYNYYQTVKNPILNWIGNRNIAFFLKIKDILVVKRNIGESVIKLTEENYNEVITGRTIQVLVERPDPSNYFVVDIDAGQMHSHNEIIEASNIVMELLNPLNIIKWENLFTSPKGLHVIGYLDKPRRVDELRIVLEKYLLKQQNYLVNVKGKRHKQINLDLTPNYKRSIHLCRYSLTKEGLICDDILTKGNRAGKKIK